MTWIANVLVLIGLIQIGSKRRSAFLFTFVGEVIWAAVGAYKGMWDLASICAVFAALAAINYHRWGKK